MIRLLTLAAAALAAPLFAADPPAGVPAGYKLQFAADFAKPDALKDFAFPDPAAWRLAKVGDIPVLEQFQNARYTPPHRSPTNFCLIADLKFAEFVMDVECQETAKESPHRDMVFVFGYQSPARFYYTHIATKQDDHANQIFIVNDAPRTKISKAANAGNDWGTDAWRTVRVSRKPADGTIRVYFDDLKKPIMEAPDKTFGAGWIGFGTFDDTCRVRKVTVWAPAAEGGAKPQFAKK